MSFFVLVFALISVGVSIQGAQLGSQSQVIKPAMNILAPMLKALSSPSLDLFKTPNKPPTNPIQPPRNPIQPPKIPIQPPKNPIQPQTNPVQPPTNPIQPPRNPIQPPRNPIQPPRNPIQPPKIIQPHRNTIQPPAKQSNLKALKCMGDKWHYANWKCLERAGCYNPATKYLDILCMFP